MVGGREISLHLETSNLKSPLLKLHATLISQLQSQSDLLYLSLEERIQCSTTRYQPSSHQGLNTPVFRHARMSYESISHTA